jgi:hypothetical protein
MEKLDFEKIEKCSREYAPSAPWLASWDTGDTKRRDLILEIAGVMNIAKDYNLFIIEKDTKYDNKSVDRLCVKPHLREYERDISSTQNRIHDYLEGYDRGMKAGFAKGVASGRKSAYMAGKKVKADKKFATTLSESLTKTGKYTKEEIQDIAIYELRKINPIFAESEYVYRDSNGEWECLCRNTSHSEGFHPCDLAGVDVEPDYEWDEIYRCDRCGRLIRRGEVIKGI